jgi:hypothetical protein
MSAVILVDIGRADGKVEHERVECEVGEVGRRCAALVELWQGEGFVKVHEAWVSPKTGEWRQKVVVVGGVEYAEEDGEDE